MNGARAEAIFSNSLFEDNLAIGGAGIDLGGSGLGGAIYNLQYASLTLVGSTVTDNAAIGGFGDSEVGDGVGGGVYNESGGSVFLDSLDAIFANFASTSDDDFFGLLSLI